MQDLIFNVPFDIGTLGIMICILVIVFFGAFIGGITGLGGGMIIKPMLGSILGMASTTIGLYISKFISTSVVFSMSLKSARISIKNGFVFQKRVFLNLAIGLILGSLLVEVVSKELSVGVEILTQGLLYTVVFFSVLLRNYYPHFKMQNSVILTIVVGMAIGFISAFFGIGGGAIKIPFFIICFSMSMKEAAVFSFLAALVTEPLKLIQYGTHILEFGGEYLVFAIIIGIICIPVAILGAILGLSIQNRSTDNFVANCFNIVIVYFAITSIYSGFLMLSGKSDVPFSLIQIFS